MNSEAWYNLTDTNIDTLEKLDNILLRKIFETGQSVPTAFLHLELGTCPIRFIIKTRRILFLQYILKEKESSLIHQFLNSQMEEPLQGDWWLSVREDLESLELNLSLHEIKSMSKDKFKKLVQKAIEAQAFSWLLWKKSKSKKVKSVPHGTSLEMQKYLAHPVLSISQTKFLFAARAKMLFVRSNYPHMYSDKSASYA